MCAAQTAPERFLAHLGTAGRIFIFWTWNCRINSGTVFCWAGSCESVIPTVRWSTSPASAIWPATFQYHLEAFDYIVKTPDRLETSIHHCLEAIQNRLLLERPAPVQVYTVQTGTSLHHIPLDEILFFETAFRPHHVLVHTSNSRMDFLGSLNEIQASLGDRFFRSHRAYLVAFDKIQKIDWKRGTLNVGGRECLLSRTAGRKLQKRMEASL